MRIVLDTNVVVSALIWGGTPYRLVQAAADGDIELCTSPALLIELRDVLGRAHLASRLAQQRSSIEQAPLLSMVSHEGMPIVDVAEALVRIGRS